MTTNLQALVPVGILKWIEDLPVFVEGLADDITSDLTTRIVFGPLVDFTADMVAAYPEFTAGTHRLVRVERQVWDPDTLAWAVRAVELPKVDDKPLLLVPRDWTSRRLLMSATRYYETTMLSYVQQERAVRNERGQLLVTPKYALEEDPALCRGRETIQRVTWSAWEQKGDDPLNAFRQYVDNRHRPLTDELILSRAA